MRCIYCNHEYFGKFCPTCYRLKPKNRLISLKTFKKYPFPILLFILTLVTFIFACFYTITKGNPHLFYLSVFLGFITMFLFIKKYKSLKVKYQLQQFQKRKNINFTPSMLQTYRIKKTDSMSGTEFEKFVVGMLECIGFYNIIHCGGPGDQGVDIIAEKDNVKYAIQCKRYQTPLGNTPVQEVYAGKMFYQCHVGVVVTNSTFSKNAIALAKSCGVLLWDRNVLSKMISDAKLDVPISDDIFYQAAIAQAVNQGYLLSPIDIQSQFHLDTAHACRFLNDMETNGIVRQKKWTKVYKTQIEHNTSFKL